MSYKDGLQELGVAEQNYRAETNDRSYGQNESSLGVATNRETHNLLLPDTPRSSVYFNSSGERIDIDLESDHQLVDFLQQIKEGVSALAKGQESQLQLATRAVEQVVFRTTVDETGAFHGRERHVTLGQALNDPVECVDRALAMEAAVKMFGITDAKMLIGVDTLANGEKVNHTDIVFVLEGRGYVAVTMGEQAGKVMTKEEYVGNYLPQREISGLGKRELKESWGHSYFEAVSARPKSDAQEEARLTQPPAHEGEAVSPTIALKKLNRRLQNMLGFDEYNAKAVAIDFYGLSKTPLWREAEERLNGLVVQRYGKSLKEEVNQRLKREATNDTGFIDHSMRSSLLWTALEEITVLEEMASSLPNETSMYDRQILEFAQLKSSFMVRQFVN